MSKGKLSTEEKALLDAVEAGEFESVLTESRKRELEAIGQHSVLLEHAEEELLRSEAAAKNTR
ncbi:hypothetical protein ACFOSD_10315 [Salinispirillum marinum]|uniref:Uncharacterized protein n=2 Tax=Saccharospirillaceae TaxID=255527 RepID=A0ABV8BHJ7_9GAMM